VSGAAVLRPVPGGLLYEETGVLRLGTHRGPTTQRYHFFFRDEQAVEVCFADGRRFHDIVFSDGVAAVTHDCPPDRYRGRYRLRDRDQWTLAWCVEGPRKRMLIGTRFTRLTREVFHEPHRLRAERPEPQSARQAAAGDLRA
jgi:Family of unknown function (DUF6314)